MAKFTSGTDWSAGITLTNDEVFQCRSGEVVLAQGGSAPAIDDEDGEVHLFANDSVRFAAGQTVYHRRWGGSAATFSRLVVSA